MPASERVATFDNDGTLWCEKPLYVQADFTLRRFAEMIKAEPALANQQPYKAVAENDREWLANLASRAARSLANPRFVVCVPSLRL